MKRAVRLLPFAALFAVSVAVQGFVILTSRIPRNSDQALTGLVAKHILDGQGHPVFFYGSTYGGTVEPHFMAALFAVFGASPEVYRGGLVALLALTNCGITAVAWKAFGERAAAGTLGFLAVPPFYFVYKELTSDGVYAPVTLSAVGVVAGAVLSLRAEAADVPRRAPWLPALLVGAAGGVGFWVSPGTLPMTFMGLCAVFFRRWDRAVVRSFVVFAASFLLGSAPWWIWNLRHSWGSVVSSDVARTDAAGVFRNLGDFATFSFPILTGTADPNDVFSASPFPAARLVAALAFGAVLVVSCWSKGKGRKTARFLALALIGVTLATAVSARFSRIEPRLAIAWYVLLAPLVGLAVATLWENKRLLAAFLAGAVICVDIASLLWAKRHVYVLSRWEVTASLQPLLRRLGELNARAVYADYWTAYRLAFESGERIIATPLVAEDLLRYEHYRRIVDSSPSPAFVILPPRVGAFERYLREKSVPHRKESVGAFGIFTEIPESVLTVVRRAQALPLPDAAYRVSWLRMPDPRPVPAGQPVSLSVAFRNASPFLWSPAVHVGYRILGTGSRGGEMAAGRGLPNTWMAPGKSFDVALTLAMPTEPGEYRVVIDLVHEGIDWFHDRGGEPLEYLVTVR